MMKPLVTSLILSLALGCKANDHQDPDMIYGFDDIIPSPDLNWTPCFDGGSCSRLEVPLDYGDESVGNTSIAFLKIPGKNATADSQSIVLMPGGPGGSGVSLLLSYRSIIGSMLGEQYNYVSFDPRGVNNSGPFLNCFTSPESRSAFLDLHSTGATNLSSPLSLQEQYYSSSIYGAYCNSAASSSTSDGGSQIGYHVTTVSVAHDLLSFINLDSPSPDGKLWAYGVSYGTVTGTTFASLFPGRVGRMVLDGVVDAEEYYTNDWRSNVEDMDLAMEKFVSLCHAAGEKGCAFFSGPSSSSTTSSEESIKSRLDSLIDHLELHPVPVTGLLPGSGSDSPIIPKMVTYSDLRTLFLNSVYRPISTFPGMAEILSSYERSITTTTQEEAEKGVQGLIGLYDSNRFQEDSRLIIQCVDSYRWNKLQSLEEYADYVSYTTEKSRYIGDVYPIFLETILCRGFMPELGDGMVIDEPTKGPYEPTAFPILFTSNTIDPITPLISAQKMSSRFPNSALLKQEAIGHTVVDQGASPCYFAHVQAYFQAGVLPPPNTTCAEEYTPFFDSLSI